MDHSGAISTDIIYNKNQKKVATIDSLGHTTTYAYDPLGRLVSTTDAQGNTVSSTYDHRGLTLTKTITPSTGTGIVTTSYAYDSDGRLVSQTDNLSQTKTLTYDNLNQVVSSHDEAGNITSYVRDYRNKITKETKYLS